MESVIRNDYFYKETKYVFLNYLNTNLIILEVTGYVNISRLCSEYNKCFSVWKKINGKKTISKTAASLCLPKSALMFKVYKTSKTELIHGVYMHKDLVGPFAEWISPTASKIVNHMLIEYYNSYALFWSLNTDEDYIYTAIKFKNKDSIKYEKYSEMLGDVFTEYEEKFNSCREITCGICLESPYDHEKLSNQYFGVLSCCNHPFCRECITEWYKKGNKTCPMCRREFFKIFIKRFL
ncbi:Zn finger-like protein [Pteropox virus]|uniref:Zn finger-like protein n=1 Tax=Pteropox virus TaxID=1873698 RepID=A0A1B1MRJ7_9POXV|nr:Zn finger-like protein [Pteropox virus]ANS71221.1 Zn finger-like protein [Pteropox virus]